MNTTSNTDILYHYTTPEGLIGIISTGKIWASDIAYLNDASEFKLVQTLLRNIVWRESAISPNKFSPRYSPNSFGHFFFSRFFELLDNIDNFSNISTSYVTSFSMIRDDLSQWRAYSPNGKGFCLGFNKSYLEENLDSKTNLFGKEIALYKMEECIYDPTKQQILLNDFIEKVDAKKEEYKNPDLDFNFISNKILIPLFIDFLSFAPKIKHYSFEKEEEIRIFSYPLQIEALNNEIKFRTKSSLIIPHIEIDLTKNANISPIIEIISGPGCDENLSRKSVINLLYSKKIDRNKVSIEHSKVPYRG